MSGLPDKFMDVSPDMLTTSLEPVILTKTRKNPLLVKSSAQSTSIRNTLEPIYVEPINIGESEKGESEKGDIEGGSKKKKKISISVSSYKKDPKQYLKSLNLEGLEMLIQKLNYAYYAKGESLVSDDLYDYSLEVLRKIDRNHKLLTSRGINIPNKVKLPFYMGSMDKIKNSSNAVVNWLSKYKGNDGYVLSDKLDGIAGLLVYNLAENSLNLYTRGDGKEGQNISSIIDMINLGIRKSDIKKYCQDKDYTSIGIRGELIVSRKSLNILDEKKGRSYAFGLITSTKPDLSLIGNVDFITYELITNLNNKGKQLSPKQQFKTLCDVFKSNTAYYKHFKKVSNEILTDFLVSRRRDSPYILDGIICMENIQYIRATTGNPKYGFAFKDVALDDRAEVVVLKVEWNISKDNYLIPLIIFPEVIIDGKRNDRVSGKNAKFIKENKIGSGSKIIVFFSGSVIPNVLEVLSDSDSGEPMMPQRKDYLWTSSGVNIYIPKNTNTDHNETCNEATRESRAKALEHFVVKVGFDGISKGSTKKLFDGGIDSIKKFINLSEEDLAGIEKSGVAPKSRAKFVAKIRDRMAEVDCITLAIASNSFGRGFGERKLKMLLADIPDLLIKKPTLQQLLNIHGIERKTAQKFLDNYSDYENFMTDIGASCKRVQYFGEDINISKTTNVILDHPIKGLNVIFSGIRNKELEKLIEKKGGVVKTSINKTTNILVIDEEKENAKDSKSKKILFAEENDIEIIDINDFKEKYQFA